MGLKRTHEVQKENAMVRAGVRGEAMEVYLIKTQYMYVCQCRAME